ncbi:MAG: hypothetical protein AB1485_04620, partial [Candidatus Thermoplasmatota archaeon]
ALSEKVKSKQSYFLCGMGRMTGKKKDRNFKPNWRVWDLASRNEVKWFLEEANKIVKKLPQSWEEKKIGRPPHKVSGKVVACLFKIRFGLTYREAESFLKDETWYKASGLDKPIGKSTIQETMAELPGWYLDKLDKELSIRLKKGKVPCDGYNRVFNPEVQCLAQCQDTSEK